MPPLLWIYRDLISCNETSDCRVLTYGVTDRKIDQFHIFTEELRLDTFTVTFHAGSPRHHLSFASLKQKTKKYTIKLDGRAVARFEVPKGFYWLPDTKATRFYGAEGSVVFLKSDPQHGDFGEVPIEMTKSKIDWSKVKRPAREFYKYCCKFKWLWHRN